MKEKSKKNPLQRLVQRIRKKQYPAWMRNHFILTGIAFLFWMAFFDDNNLIDQTQRRYRIFEQNNKIKYYENEIVKVNEEREALFGKTESLERFARERYRMVGEGEDLYLVIEQ
jgi:cell division protein DivIC